LFSDYRALPAPPSFPTRRSSDLRAARPTPVQIIVFFCVFVMHAPPSRPMEPAAYGTAGAKKVAHRTPAPSSPTPFSSGNHRSRGAVPTTPRAPGSAWIGRFRVRCASPVTNGTPAYTSGTAAPGVGTWERRNVGA